MPLPSPPLTLVSPAIPPELLLQIISHLPFANGLMIRTLRATHPRLAALLQRYERSITTTYMTRELPHVTTDFPCCAQPRFACLADCVRRYDTLDDVMDALVSRRQNAVPVRSWNVPLVHAGLLVLYQLGGEESHATRLSTIHSLPRDPLTAIFMALHHATLTARHHSTGWLHQSTHGEWRSMSAGRLALRRELERAFAEAALCFGGPGFVSDVLLRGDKGGVREKVEAALFNAMLGFGGRGRGPDIEGDPPEEDGDRALLDVGPKDGGKVPVVQGPREETPPESLYGALLERLALLNSCGVGEVEDKTLADMEDEGHPLVWLGLHGKAALLRGEDWV